MKKLATILLVAMLAVSCVCALAACNNNPLEHENAYYILAGGHPGWGVDGFDPDKLSEEVTARVMEPIAKNDERVASIKSQLSGVKYLYIIEWTYEGEAGWEKNFKPTEDTAEADITKVDGNRFVKVIMYTLQDEDGVQAWTPTWYSSPESGGQVKSLTPDTLWEPAYKDASFGLTEGSDTDYQGWNSNGVLLKGVGHYYIVFAEFNDGTFGVGAIEIAD